MRLDPDLDRVLLRPRSPGLNELIRRRMFLSPSGDLAGDLDSAEAERRLRLPRALPSRSLCAVSFLLGGERERERDGDRFVEMVETESTDEVD